MLCALALCQIFVHVVPIYVLRHHRNGYLYKYILSFFVHAELKRRSAAKILKQYFNEYCVFALRPEASV